MTRYTSSFLKSLGVSLPLVGIPNYIYFRSFSGFAESGVKLTKVFAPNKDYSFDQSGFEELAQKAQVNNPQNPTEEDTRKIEDVIDEEMNNNEFCPKDKGDKERRNYPRCKLLKEVIDILERDVASGFSSKVHLQHPTKENITLPIRDLLKNTSPDSTEIFNHYFTDHRDLMGLEHIPNYIHLLKKMISRKNEIRLIPVTQRKIGEIREFFPNIELGHYHKWRYMSILGRLNETREKVILKPMRLYQYYHLFKDPWKWGLMAEGTQYFYFSGGSEWAGNKDGKYIYSFREALDTYLPKNK